MIDKLKDQVIGLPSDQAIFIIEKAGYSWRLSKVDGNYRILTRDYRPDRFNLELEKGLVIKVGLG